ncbi:MAG: hydroxymyristoyl-ACP dehydratase [Treponema sp.]|nr:hydroxymyristoyl-ACP dehydratase [Treponema sp.]
MESFEFNENYNLPSETVISQSEGSVSVSLFVSSECNFFDGHFPEFKILPAVGQFGIVSHLALKYFGFPENVSKIKRMKFSMPILPDSKLKIDLDFNKEKKEVSFLISDADDSEIAYSSGKFS